MQVFLLPTEQLATVYRHLLCLAALPASYTAHKLMVDQGLELGHILPSHLDPSWATNTLSLSINYRFISAVVLNYVLQTSLAGGLQRLAVVRGGGLVTWVAEYLPLVAVLPCLLALVPLPASLLLLAALLANLPAALLLGVSLGQQLPQVAAALRHMYATKRDFINNFGLNTFIENEWVRLRVPSVLRCFWLSRMSAMFLLHQSPLPDTTLSPATALAAVKGVLVTGSETIVTVLGMTSVVSTLSHRLGAVLAAEAEENKSVVSVPAVLFFMMLTFVKSTFDYLKSTLIIHDLQKHSSALDPVLPSPIMNGTAPLQSDQQQGTVNTKEGHFECSICYKLISTKKGLENHINQVHNKLKRFLCKQGEDSLAYFLTICTDLRVTTITCLRSSDSI